jgi:uncharacterized membrane protein YphA (DoxX/SURF4 family)
MKKGFSAWTVLAIVVIIIAVIFLFNWNKFSSWRTTEGGYLTLGGLVIVGVLGAAKLVVDIINGVYQINEVHKTAHVAQ